MTKYEQAAAMQRLAMLDKLKDYTLAVNALATLDMMSGAEVTALRGVIKELVQVTLNPEKETKPLFTDYQKEMADAYEERFSKMRRDDGR